MTSRPVNFIINPKPNNGATQYSGFQKQAVNIGSNLNFANKNFVNKPQPKISFESEREPYTIPKVVSVVPGILEELRRNEVRDSILAANEYMARSIIPPPPPSPVSRNPRGAGRPRGVRNRNTLFGNY